MYNLKEILDRSFSKTEIVLNYTDTMELIYLFSKIGVTIQNWEGLALFPNGELVRSKYFSNRTDLSLIPQDSTIFIVKSSIMQSHADWQLKPEFEETELVYCITKKNLTNE